MELETTPEVREGWLDELSLHLTPPKTTMPLECAKAICRDLDKASAEIERLRAALSYIAWPVRTFEEQAKAEGNRIDGDMAVRLSNDHHFLKDIARRTLAT